MPALTVEASQCQHGEQRFFVLTSDRFLGADAKFSLRTAARALHPDAGQRVFRLRLPQVTAAVAARGHSSRGSERQI